MSLIRIITVADNNFIRTILAFFVASYADMVLVGEADNGSAAAQLVAQWKPDVVLIDLNPLPSDDIAAIRQIKLGNPQTHIVLLINEIQTENIQIALTAGVDEYLPQWTLSHQLATTVRMLCQPR